MGNKRSMNVSVFIFSLCISLSVACHVSPNFWCDNEMIAKECKVYEQCKEHVWSKSKWKPVELGLYYESLCPDCKDFMKAQLIPTYKKIASIIDLKLVPYGNAMEIQDGNKWKFQCQHGPEECLGNIIETCALSLVNDSSTAFQFIFCIEVSDQLPSKSAAKCAQQTGVDIQSIMSCAEGSEGNSLEHKMAVLTDQLNPPHQYVPWITINGVHTKKIQDEAEDNLLKLICDNYKGIKPSACMTKKLPKCWKESALKFISTHN